MPGWGVPKRVGVGIGAHAAVTFTNGIGANTVPVPNFTVDFTAMATLADLTAKGITFARNGIATYWNAAGVLTTVAAGQPRFDYDKYNGTLQPIGLKIEGARTNSNRNGNAVGATAGTPGIVPSFWTMTTTINGVTRTMVGSGTTADGIPYVDVSYAGTPTSAYSITIAPEPISVGVPAAGGETWVNQMWVSLTGTSMAAALGVGDLPGTAITYRSATLTSTLQPFQASRTLTVGATAVYGRLVITVPITVPVNFTLRIGACQLEKGGFCTSYIPTTNVAVTRGAEDVKMSGANAAWYSAASGSFQVYAWQYWEEWTYNTDFVLASQDLGGRALGFYDVSQSTMFDGVSQGWALGPGEVEVMRNLASSWGGALMRCAIDGNISTDLPFDGSMGTTPGEITFGSAGGLTPDAYAYAAIGKVNHWSQTLNPDQLVAITGASNYSGRSFSNEFNLDFGNFGKL